ncbi:MAG: hypothetical protein LBO72_09185, partial [Helicobacteraceae bacterium]|nr:hypothetical protein [Helicobacteraceae bacterium]
LFKSIKEIIVDFETIVTISFCAIAYEIGLIINRIGSLLESILKKFPILLPFDDDYEKYVEKEKQLPKLSTLSREYALSRTSMTLFLIMTIISCIQRQYIFLFVMVILTILFYFSTRKHASKIFKIVNCK